MRPPKPKKYPPHTRPPVPPPLSILTDEKFFGGSLRDISTARPLVDIPILRKDFIIDEYQLLQARIVGADAVLLIAACLTQKECTTLTTQAHALGLEVLLEIHNPSRAALYKQRSGYVRRKQPQSRHICHRRKKLFPHSPTASTSNSDVRNIPDKALPMSPVICRILVSESGISHPETIRSLRAAGFRGFLIGEAFMKTDAPRRYTERFHTVIETEVQKSSSTSKLPTTNTVHSNSHDSS